MTLSQHEIERRRKLTENQATSMAYIPPGNVILTKRGWEDTTLKATDNGCKSLRYSYIAPQVVPNEHDRTVEGEETR